MRAASPDEILWRHLRDLPYFRAMLRAVEDGFYQAITLKSPILDLGCGDGHFASVAFSQPLDIGLDPLHEVIHEAEARRAYLLAVQADGAIQPFEDAHFNSAVSNSVLEHIPHIQDVLNELGRVMKPGGFFVFCTPNHRFNESLWGTGLFRRLKLHTLAEGYIRLYSRIARHEYCDSPQTWKKRLDKAGFEIEKTWDYFPPQALHILEWGHLFGLPALFWRKLAGRWILVRRRWNLIFPWFMTRRFLEDPTCEDGTMSFYIARRKAPSHG
ncbi:MAG: class I SAM-dependent methyltransferase [Anaerolineaceae bacterium]|nr:class I SAM-dependent methyltransferase [Anaerolineaceae bacterium]MBN2676444.1 class I SAM-dependent methyltransferase [Anaerolineaceae bacterium]